MSEFLFRRALPRALALSASLSLMYGCTTMAKLGVGPSVSEPGTRTTALTLTDWNLAQSIRVDIYKNEPAARDAHISVVSFYEAVLLVGEVPNADMKARIGEIARRYNDVRVVHNELSVANNRSTMGDIEDDLLERKAGFSLFTADGLRSSQARVVANNGTIYLMGKLTQRELERAIVRLQALDGVRRIVKIVDVLPDTAPEARQAAAMPTT